jgi:hypothetical protein
VAVLEALTTWAVAKSRLVCGRRSIWSASRALTRAVVSWIEEKSMPSSTGRPAKWSSNASMLPVPAGSKLLSLTGPVPMPEVPIPFGSPDSALPSGTMHHWYAVSREGNSAVAVSSSKRRVSGSGVLMLPGPIMAASTSPWGEPVSGSKICLVEWMA